LQREKLVIIGGSGQVGREVCRLAVSLGHEVLSISLDGEPELDRSEERWMAGVEWKKGDIEKWREWACFDGALSVVLCTPPLDLTLFHNACLEKGLRVVTLCLASYPEDAFSGYDRSYIMASPFKVVEEEDWTIDEQGVVHVSNLAMALLRLSLEEEVSSMGGEELVHFGDVMILQ